MNYSDITKSALGEFLLMHHSAEDPNLVASHIVHYFHKRSQCFLNSWSFLIDELQKFEPDIRTSCYAAGKAGYGDEKINLRDWFADMNLVLFNTKVGPQLSAFIDIYGIDPFITKVNDRLNNPIRFFM